MAITPAKMFSILGNPNSLIPLAIKDASATAGMTAGSFVTGKEEGVDRFIDEAGTEVIWLFGIPAYKKLFDKTVFKMLKFDAKFDPRNLKDRAVFEKIKEFAPTEEIKKNLEKIESKQKLFKGAAGAKFVISTAMTVLTYLGLTKFKQNYTEKKIKENLVAEHNSKKQQEENSSKGVSFKGLGSTLESFVFSPVKNMWLLDGCIAAERFTNSRSKQELYGYIIKEATFFTFMYLIGNQIQQTMETLAKKKHSKSIGLDARVLESEELKNAFENGSVEKSLKEFGEAAGSDVKLYEFLHKNPDNFVVQTAKKSDLIEMYKKTDKIDTRKFIDLKEVKGVNESIKELYGQYKKALANGETSEKFFAGVKKLKRGSILTNIGTCIFALGIFTPALMLLKRKTEGEDMEFHTKKQIREQLIKDGVIA